LGFPSHDLMGYVIQNKTRKTSTKNEK